MTMVMSGKRTAQSTETMQQDNAKTLHPIMSMNESWICLAHHTKLVPWQALGLVVAEFKLQEVQVKCTRISDLDTLRHARQPFCSKALFGEVGWRYAEMA